MDFRGFRLLRRILAFWPLLLAFGWFASTTRLAGHLHANHEQTAHLDDARGDWAGDCELCRGAAPKPAGPATRPAPFLESLVADAPPAPAAETPRVAGTDFPPLAPRPPPDRT